MSDSPEQTTPKPAPPWIGVGLVLALLGPAVADLSYSVADVTHSLMTVGNVLGTAGMALLAVGLYRIAQHLDRLGGVVLRPRSGPATISDVERERQATARRELATGD